MRIAVVGAGITGLALTSSLVQAGHDVRCFEAGTPMRARSVGGTRIFRAAHRRPELVDWAMRARHGWDHWSAEAGEQLVGTQGTVVSGDVAAWAGAMAAAGAPHTISDEAPGLPADDAGGPFLLDPAGGAIQAEAAGRFLVARIGSAVLTHTRVTAVAADGTVTTDDGGSAFDSVVVTAGSGTAALAAPLGIEVPTTLVRHARFTYPLRDPARTPPCWLEESETWETGFTTYQHLAGPGRWAIGGHFPLDLVAWGVAPDDATAVQRDVVTRYAAERISGVEPTVVETVTCDFEHGLGDGLTAGRNDRVLALWGDNLFKMAPVLAATVARAATDLSLPDDLLAVRNDPQPGRRF
jgi:sarcosine oxidase